MTRQRRKAGESPQEPPAWGDYWAKKAERRRLVVDAGVIMVTRQDSRLQIACPYDVLFVSLAQAAGATWRFKSKVWSFPSGKWIAGLDAVVKCYGAHRLTPDWEHYWKTEKEKHDQR